MDNLFQYNAVILYFTGLRWINFLFIKDEHKAIGAVILLYGAVKL